MLRKFLLTTLLFALTQECSAEDNQSAVGTSASGKASAVQTVDKTLSRPIKDKWALIIGISKFDDKNIPPLRFAAKDADDLCRFLTTKANFKRDHILLLKDSQASKQNILEAVGDGWLPKRVMPDDLVVIFISTHGSSSDRAEQNFIVASDTRADKLYSTGIRLQDLPSEITKQTGCDRLVMLLDACHSGAVELGGKGLARSGNLDVDELVGTGQIVISSSQKDEISWESRRHDNSVFTACLLDALQCKGPNTKLTEAFDSLKEKVEQEVRFDRRAFQRPLLRSKWQGDDMILSAMPADPRQVLPELPEEKSSSREANPSPPARVATSNLAGNSPLPVRLPASNLAGNSPPPVRLPASNLAGNSPPPVRLPASNFAGNSPPLVKLPASNLVGSSPPSALVATSKDNSWLRPISDKWAFVVGISRFQNPSLNCHYASKDAKDFYDYLINDAGFARDHVILLQDEKATRANILSIIQDDWLPRSVQHDDLAVIYFSGQTSPYAKEEGANHLLCYDSNPSMLYSTGISFRDLSATIRSRIGADRRVLILDASHAASLAAAGQSGNQDNSANRQFVLISSCLPGQCSWESKHYQNSVFTRCLIDGFKSKGKNTTIDEAFQYASKHLEAEQKADRGSLQTPELLNKGDSGRLSLAATSSKPRAASP